MNRIKEVLVERGVKQIWLAEKLGKSYNMVNSYVQNRRQPSLELLLEIASILEVNVKDLIDVKNSNKVDAKETQQTIEIPLVGEVACGIPILAQENVEAYISVSTKLVNDSDNYFLLRASGDSMDKKGINSGDLLLIRQKNVAESGDIVLALIDDDATVKEFIRNESIVVLKPHSTNPIHQPIILTYDFKIQGIVENIISL